MAERIHIGCQGWNYADWVSKALGEEVYYPRGTKSAEMLSVYAKAFDTVEVDSTFYAIPAESAVEGWYRKTPQDFSFSLKLPREITHERALHQESLPVLHAFCERVSALKEKLATVLVQLPPTFDATKENAVRLRRFLAALPADIHFSVEFRNRDWMVDWTFRELESRGVSVCLVEGSWIPRQIMFDRIGDLKSPKVYVRFMGERDIEKFDRVHRAMDANLSVWTEELKRIDTPAVYVYFSNFYEGLAPVSANKLREMLGQRPVQATELDNQKGLFSESTQTTFFKPSPASFRTMVVG